MKYLEKYIEEKLKIKVLGQLKTAECPDGESVGVSLVIDGFEPGIYIWYADYAKWLEEKLDEKLVEKPSEEKMPLQTFREDVLTAMKNKPKDWRDGQFVFNYIDEKYGVARYVQQVEGVDCFYKDNAIDEFIVRSYETYINYKYKN